MTPVERAEGTLRVAMRRRGWRLRLRLKGTPIAAVESIATGGVAFIIGGTDPLVVLARVREWVGVGPPQGGAPKGNKNGVGRAEKHRARLAREQLAARGAA